MTVIPNSRSLAFSFLFSAAVLAFPLAGQAQGGSQGGSAQQKIESLKIAYISQQLDLDPAQAQKFWPVYNEYQAALRQLGRKRRKNMLNQNQLQKASDSQINQSLDKDFDYQKQALKIREQYRDKFSKVLPPEKVMQLYRAERDFNLKLIRELHRRQKNGHSS